MGTNFYLMSRNKKLMREHFAVETETIFYKGIMPSERI